ncbi:MAG: hypothetical protein KBS72_08495 [Bacteroidales bacterium]|nr:hypothetical protein [Candidatus Cacconaster scatequi]
MVHNGLRGHIQRYKCKDCGHRFDGGIRRDKSQVITDYVEGKQTLDQLALKYGVNERTIRRDLEGMRYVQKISKYKHVTVQMDTTYWGRRFGLMAIRDALRGKVLKRNMPLLWTFYDHPETGLPNTNNGIEGMFSDLKTKVRVHSGICRDNRRKLLDEYIKRNY